eukprot:5989245-Amphidinium_carterae.1
MANQWSIGLDQDNTRQLHGVQQSKNHLGANADAPININHLQTTIEHHHVLGLHVLTRPTAARPVPLGQTCTTTLRSACTAERSVSTKYPCKRDIITTMRTVLRCF